MASLLSPRRTERDLVLRASTPSEPTAGGATAVPTPSPRLGWAVAAVGGGLLCALTGWLLVAGLAVVGWVAAEPGTLVGALLVGSQLWHGVGIGLGTLEVTLVPWGVPALTGFLLSRASAFAVRSARPEQRPRALPVALLATAAYLAPVLVAAVLLGRPGLAPGHLLAVVVVLLAAAAHGAGRALDVVWTRSWPAWARAVPRAVLASQLVLLAAGAAVLVTGLATHLDRVTALQTALAPGITGGIALLAAQLALAPNAIVWSASYALGGGFTLGNGSVVAPAATDLGALPGLPLLGALPAEGPGPTAALWWLAAGVAAGAVAAWLVVRARPHARFDETSLVGGLAGLLGGLVFVVLAWAVGGDAGTLRLAGLGPLLLPLLVMSVTTLGLAGMVTGLLLGLAPHLRRRQPTGATDGAEATEVLARDTADPEQGPGAAAPVWGWHGVDTEATEVLPHPGTARSEDPGSSR
jgi:hypothetical protein